MRAIKLTNEELSTCQVAVSHLLDWYMSVEGDSTQELAPECLEFVAHMKRVQGVLSNPKKSGREVLS